MVTKHNNIKHMKTKTVIQCISGAFLLGAAQVSFAGADCKDGHCDASKAAAATKTVATTGEVCEKSGHCDVSKAAKTVATGEVCDKGECSVAKGECDASKVAALAEGHERVEYVVSGLTCEGCTSAVTSSLEKVEGVTVQSVCHKSGTAVVDFDAAKASKADVAGAINQGEILVAAERVTVPVTGMTCGACSTKVTDALNAVDGVTVQTVCHKSGKAVVDVAEKSNRDAVVKVITDAGYKAG